MNLRLPFAEQFFPVPLRISTVAVRWYNERNTYSTQRSLLLSVNSRSFHGAMAIIEILFLKAHGLVGDVHSLDCVQPNAQRTNSDKIILDNIIPIDNNWQRCQEPWWIRSTKNESRERHGAGRDRCYVSMFVSSWVAVSEQK